MRGVVILAICIAVIGRSFGSDDGGNQEIFPIEERLSVLFINDLRSRYEASEGERKRSLEEFAFKMQFVYWVMTSKLGNSESKHVESRYGRLNKKLLDSKEFVSLLEGPPWRFGDDGAFIGFKFVARHADVRGEVEKKEYSVDSKEEFDHALDEFGRFLRQTVQ